jgi:O-antigen/teichoic acid export membrane protein
MTARPYYAPTAARSAMVWNLGSLAILAAAGFALNLAIGRFYGPEALGVFNICFAGFIFIAQIGSFGVQFSILQAVAEHSGRDQGAVDDAVSAGLRLVVMASSLSTLGALLITPLVAGIYDSEDIVVAWLTMLPGLWAFSLNKYLLGVVNGAGHMRTFAALQASRYLLILVWVAVFYFARVDGAFLTGVLSLSEIMLLAAAAGATRRVVSRWSVLSANAWFARHRTFGMKAFLSGAILELNTRINVLIVGALIGEASAGIYSVGILVAEGVSQVIFVIRNVANPPLARALATQDQKSLLKLSREFGAIGLGLTLAGSVVAYFLYPWFAIYGMGDQRFLEATLSLAILLVGLTLTAPMQVFGLILSMAQRPGLHTLSVLLVLVVNAALNFMLVPVWGMTGSALATAISYGVSAAIVLIAARTVLKVRLFF